MICNYELEQHLLAGLIKYPEAYTEIAAFISEKDFHSEDSSVNQTIFSVLKSSLDGGESLDEIVLAQRVRSLGISFEDNINITDYIKALGLRKISESSVRKTAQELKKYTIRREIAESGINVAKKMKSISPNSSYDDIISIADKSYNETIDLYETGTNIPENIYSNMEEVIEDRGNNPIDEVGLVGPHTRLHEIYGSLLIPGNITVIAARSGVGKTQFCMDFCTKVSSLNNNIPVLHFDNGEMSLEELQMRQCAALSGVPLSLLSSGRWRNAGDDVVKRVRAVWPKIKEMQFGYYQCGGMSIDQMINVARRYYSKIGRGNPMVLSFDYIKTTFEPSGNKSEWQIVGEMVDKFKRLIMKELVFEDGPAVSMMTSVQMNRIGTSRNRQSSNIVEDETVISLSDRITQYCSHMFLLRSKEPDEIAQDAGFGSHKLTSIKSRHLGQDPEGAIHPVRMADGSLRNNYINLDFNNFNITERGDLRDLVEHLRVEGLTPEEDGSDDLPALFNNG
jgi:replicative DNA helicase